MPFIQTEKAQHFQVLAVYCRARKKMKQGGDFYF